MSSGSSLPPDRRTTTRATIPAPGMRSGPEAGPKVARRGVWHPPGMETFVVRAWRPAADEAASAEGGGALRGVVEHVATGATIPFRDAEQLVAFLQGGGVEESAVRAAG